jgi:dihydroorotate dehydrogenase electron transfer subunit
MNDFPQTHEILEVKAETPSIKTLVFDKNFDFTPGQFVMTWIPSVDEIPLSLSGPNQVTVKDVGKASHALCNKKPGEYVGLRGPYGHGFSLPGEKILAVGGGFGTAVLKPLATIKNKEVAFVVGAKTREELLFEKQLPDCLVCTDDGSCGQKCFTTVLAEQELKQKKYDLVAACGPEAMLKALFQLCEKLDTPVEFSMERFMKCGVGICGHCAVDSTGWRVCKDGPVANTQVLRQNPEFFNYKRDQTGKKVKV